MDKEIVPITKIAVFKKKEIRKTIYENEWWFSVVDVVGALTDSVDPGAYWRKLKQRLGEEGSEFVTFCHGLKLIAPDGKMRETDCANTEAMFRIIQSIPSPKAEPFKKWLAKVGYERVQEIEDPELTTKRTRAIYKAKGKNSGKFCAWINKEQYFDNIPENVCSFHIGGYQVLDHWLKERKGRKLTSDDINSVQQIVSILDFTITQMAKIEKIAGERI